jgi:ribosome-associated protein
MGYTTRCNRTFKLESSLVSINDQKDQILDLLNSIAQKIFDKKGENILALDVHDISSLTDFFIIADGNVSRHLNAIANEIIELMVSAGHSPLYMDGGGDSDWIVIDFGEIIVHLFTAEMREKYALEQLWREGKLVDLTISLP